MIFLVFSEDEVHVKWINFHILRNSPLVLSLSLLERTLHCVQRKHTKDETLASYSFGFFFLIVSWDDHKRDTFFLEDFKCILMEFLFENNTTVLYGERRERTSLEGCFVRWLLIGIALLSSHCLDEGALSVGGEIFAHLA